MGQRLAALLFLPAQVKSIPVRPHGIFALDFTAGQGYRATIEVEAWEQFGCAVIYENPSKEISFMCERFLLGLVIK